MLTTFRSLGALMTALWRGIGNALALEVLVAASAWLLLKVF
jgi:hypothetical protein